jgi:hypothetical protein
MPSSSYYDSFLYNNNSDQDNNNSTLFHYNLNQPQNDHDDVEVLPSKYNDQKNKIIVKNPVTWCMNIKEVLLKSKLNFLLIFLLPAIIMESYEKEEFILFFPYFLATIPLIKILAGSIKDLSSRLHPVNWILQNRILFLY